MVRRVWTVSLLLLCVSLPLTLTACGSETGPAEPTAQIVVSPADPLLRHVDDSLVLAATKGGVPVGPLTLGFVSETREVAELPVLEPAALQRGVLRPAGPGSAVLDVASPQGKARVTVRVATEGPTVFNAVTTRRSSGVDTVTLIGTKLEAVPLEGGLRVGGQPVSLSHRDAHRLRFAVPVVSPLTCEGPAARVALELPGGQVPSALRVPVARTGELNLAVGEHRFLTPDEAACVRLPATSGEYVLAYADLRQEVAGQNGWAGWPGDGYEVQLRDRTVPGASPVAVAISAVEERPGMHSAAAPHVEFTPPSSSAVTCSDTDFSQPTFWCRSKPWVEGDVMTIRKPGSSPAEYVTATIWRVFGNGRFPVAVVDGDDSPDLLRFMAGIEVAMPEVARVSVPLFESVFGTSAPMSSEPSGQLLSIIGDFQHSSVGWGCCFGGPPWAVVTLGSWHAPWASEVFYLFTHEFAHAWQQRWFFDHRPEGGDIVPTAVWANEGGADLLAYEAQRRYAQVPWRANRTVASFTDGANPDGPMLREVMMAQGDLTIGYTHGSSFFRDVVARMMVQGASMDDAYRALTLGSLEEWHGWDLRGAKRPGLTARVSAFLPGWEVGDAMLLYTLSQGADEMTSSTVLQNPFYHSVATDTGSEGFAKVSLATGSGTHLSVSRIATSLGYVRLHEGGAGASVETSANRPHLRWAIARVR